MPDAAPALAVKELVCRLGDPRRPVTAVDGVSLEVAAGELYAILGPSGCGKTTLLRAVAGLAVPTAGQVLIHGTIVAGGLSRPVPPHRRGLGMVFQSYGIWPHLNVFENAAFPLRVARPWRPWPTRSRRSQARLRERVEEVLALVQLAGLADRPATQLSGGQQQRLALARALVCQPRLLLLDEPLSSLDTKLREAMRSELLALQRRLGITTVYVTHDQAEALSLADRVAVLAHGRIVEQGSPRELYRRPRTRFVAEFVGAANLVPGAVRASVDGHLQLDTGIGPLVTLRGPAHRDGAPVVVAVRPEQVRLHQAPPPGRENLLPGEIDQQLYLGDRVDYRVRVGDRSLWVRRDPAVPAATGDRVWLELPPPALLLYPGGDSPEEDPP